MIKEELLVLVNENKTIEQISNVIGKSKTTTRYWLSKYDLKTVPRRIDVRPTSNTRVCPNCKQEKDLSEFYTRREKEGTGSYCKTCTSVQTKIRQQKLKEDAVNYKGGKCLACGYNKYQGALEFHHVDPSEKDFNISQSRFLKLQALKPELDKCILLCSNCHKEIHGGLIKYVDGKILPGEDDKLTWSLKRGDTALAIKKNMDSIIKDIQQGKDITNIAKSFNSSRGYLLKILNESKIYLKNIQPKESRYPSDGELKVLVYSKPLRDIAHDLGISDVALAKHCKKQGIEKPPRGYWAKLKYKSI